MLFLILIFFGLSSIESVAMDELDGTGRSQEEAAKRTNKFYPGRIMVLSGDGKSQIDYASAIPLGLPEKSETKAILSCAHIYNDCRKSDSICQFYYCDYKGGFHGVEWVYPLYEESPIIDSTKDVAIYRIKEPIPCNPSILIASEASQTPLCLSTLSHGWVPNREHSLIVNPTGDIPYYFSKLFELTNQTYCSSLKAGHLAKITRDEGKNRCIYWCEEAPQLFLYDSGSPWFTEEDDKVILHGVASTVTTVRYEDEQATEAQTPKKSCQFIAITDPLTFELFQLAEPRDVIDTLTSLHHLSERIYEYITKDYTSLLNTSKK